MVAKANDKRRRWPTSQELANPQPMGGCRESDPRLITRSAAIDTLGVDPIEAGIEPFGMRMSFEHSEPTYLIASVKEAM